MPVESVAFRVGPYHGWLHVGCMLRFDSFVYLHTTWLMSGAPRVEFRRAFALSQLVTEQKVAAVQSMSFHLVVLYQVHSCKKRTKRASQR